MPTFCRHNRLLHNCPICAREQQIEARPVISSSAPRSSLPRTPGTSAPRQRSGSGRSGSGRAGSGQSGSGRSGSGRSSGSAGVRVRRLARGGDDGYRCSLVPGLKSSADAERLADELAFAATRHEVLATDPPGLYAEVAAPGDLEERTWLAFLIAYIGPVAGEDPFASVRAVRTTWASGEQPDPEAIEAGPRGAHDSARGTSTLDAYRTWAGRAGSQAAAFAGEAAWSPPRRFARAFERLALPGFHRDARFELLVSLGRLGLYELEAGSLALGGDNSVTVGAKRALGIGDPLLLDRRAAELAQACGIALEALDLAFFNWESQPSGGTRATGGLPDDAEPAPEIAERTYAALRL